MNIAIVSWFLLSVSLPQSGVRSPDESAERVMEARFHLQEIFDRDLSAKVPVPELNLPSDTVSGFDENGDGFVTFDELESLEKVAPEPQAPQDRSGFTHLREGGFPLNLNPEIVPADEAPLGDHDIVIGVVINGEARAYPVNYTNGPYNEVVNDRLGGQAIAPSW